MFVKKNNVKHLLLLILLVHMNIIAYGCICNKQKINEKDLSDAKIIFIGRVIKITPIEGDYNINTIRTTFIVQKPFKNAKEGDTISVYSSSDVGICGIDFKINTQWYIFSKDIENRNYWINACGRSLLLGMKNYRQIYTKEGIKKIRSKFRRNKKYLRDEIKFINKNK